GAEAAVDVRRAMQARAHGDVEAGVEDGAEVVGREGFRDDQREGPDVRLGFPPAGDPPPFGIPRPVDDPLEQLDLVTTQVVGPAAPRPTAPRGPGRRRPAGWGSPPPGCPAARGAARGWTSPPRPRLPATGAGGRRCGAPHRGRLCPSGRRAPCGRGTREGRS